MRCWGHGVCRGVLRVCHRPIRPMCLSHQNFFYSKRTVNLLTGIGQLPISRNPICFPVIYFRVKHKGSVYMKTCVNCGEKIRHAKSTSTLCYGCRKEAGKHKGKTRYKKVCAFCGDEFEAARNNTAYCSDECSNDAKSKRVRERELASRQPIKCGECGVMFLQYNEKQKYCSLKCERKNAKKRHPPVGKLRKRMRKYGTQKRDKGVTLRAVMARDKGICHICGGKVNISDHTHDERGFFICGSNYPTIDHVLPLSRGGGHTWDNVRLSHHLCNSVKGNREAYAAPNGQMRFAI
jgi:5-methylcytosine-specific restriction endonuclease McrA